MKSKARQCTGLSSNGTRMARMRSTEKLREPIARFAFSAALAVAANGVSKPKKFSIRLPQTKKAKNPSTPKIRFLPLLPIFSLDSLILPVPELQNLGAIAELHNHFDLGILQGTDHARDAGPVWSWFVIR